MRIIKTFSLLLAVLSLCLGLTGCKSEVQNLRDTCMELDQIAYMTDDCDKMAKALAPALERFQKRIEAMDSLTGEEQQRDYVIEVGLCMSSLFQIRSEACKNHESVVSALERMDFRDL